MPFLVSLLLTSSLTRSSCSSMCIRVYAPETIYLITVIIKFTFLFCTYSETNRIYRTIWTDEWMKSKYVFVWGIRTKLSHNSLIQKHIYQTRIINRHLVEMKREEKCAPHKNTCPCTRVHEKFLFDFVRFFLHVASCSMFSCCFSVAFQTYSCSIFFFFHFSCFFASL